MAFQRVIFTDWKMTQYSKHRRNHNSKTFNNTKSICTMNCSAKTMEFTVCFSQKNRSKWIKIGTLRKANTPLCKWVSWKPELSSICVGDVATQLSGSDLKILVWPGAHYSWIHQRGNCGRSVELERLRAPCEAEKICLMIYIHCSIKLNRSIAIKM